MRNLLILKEQFGLTKADKDKYNFSIVRIADKGFDYIFLPDIEHMNEFKQLFSGNSNDCRRCYFLCPDTLKFYSCFHLEKPASIKPYNQLCLHLHVLFTLGHIEVRKAMKTLAF